MKKLITPLALLLLLTSIVPASPDVKVRQTARPWTGAPTGPENDFEAADRDSQLHIQQVMDLLKIGPGKVVADVGAGGGWFTVRAARRAGPTGIVYAEEILPKYTRYIDARARREGLNNVRTILGTTTDPKLPRNSLDAVLILNAYHEFDAPLRMLAQVRSAMKPGARLAFIERDDYELRRAAREAFRKTGKIKRNIYENPAADPYTDDHKLARDVVEMEAAQAGFIRITTLDLRDDNYLVVVEKKP